MEVWITVLLTPLVKTKIQDGRHGRGGAWRWLYLMYRQSAGRRVVLREGGGGVSKKQHSCKSEGVREDGEKRGGGGGGDGGGGVAGAGIRAGEGG